jgi:hypothetical protein
VTATVKRTTFALQVLEFADASGRTQALRTTPEHPFWTVNHHKFRSAGRLQPGDTFISPGGQFQTLTATESESHPDGIFVYNFTVEIAHTYFVSATKDDQPLLVHNANCGPGNGPGGKRNGGESAAAARGREAHQQFKEQVRQKDGRKSQPRLIDPNTGKTVIPDALTPSGRPVELKPRTPSGIAAGKSQLQKYERAAGKKGRVIYYDP